MGTDPYEFSLRSMDEASLADESGEFCMADMQFAVHEGVFPPTAFPSTRLFTEMIPFRSGRSFLEVGCGAGVTAIVASKAGCEPVVAIDINPMAVVNAKENVRRHRLEAKVSVFQGDIFAPLPENMKFDTIYWNSNFVFVASDYTYKDNLQRAFFDAGYFCHDRYVSQAHKYLTSDGELLLGFSDLGDRARLEAIGSRNQYEIRTLDSRRSDEEGCPTYYLFHFVRRMP